MTTTLPDTALVRTATDLVTAALPAPVLAHSYRAFLLGRAYGIHRGLEVDEEGLLLAALFHDLGLAEAMRDRRRAFTEVGAEAVERFLAERGDPRGPALADAIVLHMQLLPRWKRGPVVGLLQVGAWMDATGRRSRTVGRELIASVEAEHPRGDFQRMFRRSLLASLGSWRSCFRLVVPGPPRAQLAPATNLDRD